MRIHAFVRVIMLEGAVRFVIRRRFCKLAGAAAVLEVAFVKEFCTERYPIPFPAGSDEGRTVWALGPR